MVLAMVMVSISRGDARDNERLPCSVEISTVRLLVQGILPISVIVCLGRFPTTLVVGLGFVQRRVASVNLPRYCTLIRRVMKMRYVCWEWTEREKNDVFIFDCGRLCRYVSQTLGIQLGSP
ncbi:uncharacterized protein DS421_16g546990 [Arachis hypogaea]|nr:uncharacterized protein DS421_16g546990 [Arachis hypogaea]